MFCGENDELAKIAVFEFMLGETEDRQIEAFNKILRLVGVKTELTKSNGCYIWQHCSYDDQYTAEKLFDGITHCLSYEAIQDMLEHEQLFNLISQYRKVINETTGKMEPLSWVGKFPDMCS